jgi:phosphate-selective porin OprO and OprP
MNRGGRILVAVCLAPAFVLAQQPAVPARPVSPGRPARAEVADLRARVEDLSRVLADMPALQKQLRDIEALLLRVQAQIDRFEGSGAPGRDAEARQELDNLRAALGDLRERVARLEYEARLRRDEGFGADREGPVLYSADGAFALGLGALLKFRAEALGREEGQNEFGFSLKNAKLILDGHAFSPNLRFAFQADFGRGEAVLQDYVPADSGGVRAVLEDYFVEVSRWAPWAVFRFGQFKVPFGRQRLAPSSALQLTDLSVATQHFELGRDIGLELQGDLDEGRLAWWAAALNGAGPNAAANDNQDLLWVLRVVLSPWGPVPLSEGDVAGQPTPKVSVGGSIAYTLRPTDIVARTGNPGADYDQDGDGHVDNVAQTSVALEATAHWRGASLELEYDHRKEDAGAVLLFDGGQAQAKSYDGMHVQAGYFVIPAHLEAAFRAAFADPSGYGLLAAERAQLPDRIRELAVVLSYLRYGHHLKLQGEYANLHATPAERDDHRFRIQLQLDF